jgi:phage terminase small subunit
MPDKNNTADSQEKESNQSEEKKDEKLTSQKSEEQTRQSWWDGLNEEQKQEVETEASERGFKSVGDFWNSYREAEKKISNQGQTLGQARKFEESVVPILRIIRENPELLKAVQSKLGGSTMTGQGETNNNQESADKDVRTATESMIVSKFESAHGLNNLDEESRQEVRATIGKHMAKWVKPNQRIPLDQLEGYLEDALVIAQTRDKKLGKMLGDIQQQDEHGKLSSLSGSSRDAEGDIIELIDEQKKVAQGLLGGDIEKYTQGLKKLQGS